MFSGGSYVVFLVCICVWEVSHTIQMSGVGKRPHGGSSWPLQGQCFHLLTLHTSSSTDMYHEACRNRCAAPQTFCCAVSLFTRQHVIDLSLQSLSPPHQKRSWKQICFLQLCNGFHMGVLGSKSTTKRVYKPLRCTCSGFQSSTLGTSGDPGTMIELLWASSIQLLGCLWFGRQWWLKLRIIVKY